MRGHKQFFQLRADALGTDIPQGRRKFLRRAPSLFVQDKSQLCAEPDRAEDPQGVLGKSLRGVSYAPYDPRFKILPSAEQVDQSVLFIVSHRVDGEIAPLQILFQAGSKVYLVRMPVIRILSVDPVGRNLQALPVHAHRHGAMLDSGINRPGKCAGDLL